MKDYLHDLWFFRKAFLCFSIVLGFINWVFVYENLNLVQSIILAFINCVILFTIIYLMDKFNMFEKIAKFLFK